MDKLPEIRRSLCIYDQAKNKIVAFYEGDIDRKQLSRSLVKYVPNFMVPNVFVQVDTMPLTKNGKIDRKELTARYQDVYKRQLLDGIVKKGSRTYFYKNGVMQKNCWSPDKKQYFGKNGVAYAAPKVSGCKKNIVVKKIGKKYYGFDRNGFKVKKGVYADAKGTPY